MWKWGRAPSNAAQTATSSFFLLLKIVLFHALYSDYSFLSPHPSKLLPTSPATLIHSLSVSPWKTNMHLRNNDEVKYKIKQIELDKTNRKKKELKERHENTDAGLHTQESHKNTKEGITYTHRTCKTIY